MKRALLVGMALCGALSVADRAEAQVRIYFGATLDTAVGLIPGKSMPIPIRASYLPCGTDSVHLTLRYDPTVIQIDSAAPGIMSTAFSAASPGTGLYAIRGTGSCAADPLLFRVFATLQAATNGSYVWTSVDTLGLGGYVGDQAVALGRSSIAQFCHASTVYGDVDHNGVINSRDALIVLSHAVGLPVAGFDLAVGDVDRDGLANSRDALIMLSYSIGLTGGLPTGLQIGEGAEDACPGTTAPGEAVVFKRNGAGIELLGAPATTPTLVPNTVPGDSAPRLLANGTEIVYQCQDSVTPVYSDICIINTDGTGRRPLSNAYYYTQPDVSPNGIRVLFSYYFNSGPLYLTTDTASAIVTPEFLSGGYGLNPYATVWSRDGGAFVYTSGGFYTTWNSQVYTFQPRGLWKVDTSAVLFTQLDTAFTASVPAPRVSPNNDSAAYVRQDGRIWAVPMTGGVPATPYTNFLAINNSNSVTSFDWGPQGLVFSFDAWGNGSHPSLWLLSSQTAVIQRLTAPATGDWQPSFRRNP